MRREKGWAACTAEGHGPAERMSKGGWTKDSAGREGGRERGARGGFTESQARGPRRGWGGTWPLTGVQDQRRATGRRSAPAPPSRPRALHVHPTRWTDPGSPRPLLWAPPRGPCRSPAAARASASAAGSAPPHRGRRRGSGLSRPEGAGRVLRAEPRGERAAAGGRPRGRGPDPQRPPRAAPPSRLPAPPCRTPPPRPCRGLPNPPTRTLRLGWAGSARPSPGPSRSGRGREGRPFPAPSGSSAPPRTRCREGGPCGVGGGEEEEEDAAPSGRPTSQGRRAAPALAERHSPLRGGHAPPAMGGALR